MKIKDLPKVDRPREKLDPPAPRLRQDCDGQTRFRRAGKYGPAVPVRLVRQSPGVGGSFMRRKEQLSDSELLAIIEN